MTHWHICQGLQAYNVHEVIVEASFVVVGEMAKSDQPFSEREFVKGLKWATSCVQKNKCKCKPMCMYCHVKN